MNIKHIFLILIFSITSNLFAEEFILNSEPKFIPDFKTRFTFLAGLNPSMTKSNEIKNFHFSYGKNSFENQWWDFSINYTNAYLNKISTNNSNATSLTSAQFSDQTYSTHLALGIGLNYETRYLQTLLPFNGLYESIGASITYNTLKSDLMSNTFTGPGMIAKYSALKRFNDYFALGANFIYNLAVVKRSANSDSETSSNQSLTLSYLTLGIDLSFYL